MATTTISGWNALGKTGVPQEWPVTVDVINEFFNRAADTERLKELIEKRVHTAADESRKLLISYTPFYFASVWKTFATVVQLIAPKPMRLAWSKEGDHTEHMVRVLSSDLKLDSEVYKDVCMDVYKRLPSDFNFVIREGKRGQVGFEFICKNPLNRNAEIGLLALVVKRHQTAGEYYFGGKSAEETPQMIELARKLRGEPAPEHEQALALAHARVR